jgi:hypothetical protein
MTMHIHETAELGELVVAAFDEAALQSDDPEEISCLATNAVLHALRRAPWHRESHIIVVDGADHQHGPGEREGTPRTRVT